MTDAHSQSAATDGPPPAPHTLQDRLRRLAGDFESFGASLTESLMTPLRQGLRPHDTCADGLLELLDRFDTLQAEVLATGVAQSEALSIATMLEAVERTASEGAWSLFQREARTLLEGVPRITHAAAESPPALVILRDAASRLLSELPETSGDVAAWQARVSPFAALWTLLTVSDLDDDVAEQLEATVAAAFGETLVRRSFITKLKVVDPAAGVQSVTAEDRDTPRPAEAPSLATAPSPAAAPSRADEIAAVRPEPATPSHAVQTRHDGDDALPKAAVVVDSLPRNLVTFDAFRADYWLNPATGTCETVPWSADGMVHRLRELSGEILAEIAAGNDTRLPELWLASRALEPTGRAVVSLATVRSIADLIAEPTRTAAGRDSQRAQRIPRLDRNSAAEVRLNLALEAIRPTALALVPDEERDRLFAVADFRDGTIKSVIADLFRAHAQALVDPLEQIRLALETNIEGRPDPTADLVEKRQALERELVRLQRNAGSGYVGIFDHCSAAWMEFMRAHARPFATRLEGPPTAHKASPTTADVDLLLESYRAIADDGGVREKARRIMDRAAESLGRHLADVASARQAVADGMRAKSPPNKRLVDEAKRLMVQTPPTDPTEHLALRLLRIALAPPLRDHIESPLRIGTRFLSTYPTFLDWLDEPLDWNSLPTVEDLPADRPEEIAGTLIYPRPDALPDSDRRALETRCREERRYERLAKLRSPLPTQDQAGANQEKSCLLIELQHRKDRLRKGWRALEGLLVASQSENRRILDSVERTIGPHDNHALVCAWLDQVCEFTERQVQDAVNHWRTILASDPGGQTRLAALESGQYARATREADSHGSAFSPLRETAWRHEAEKRFPEPRRPLIAQRATSSIADKWVTDLQDKGKRHNVLLSLLTDFTKWVFPPSLQAAATKERTKFVIETQCIRDYMSPTQPTYLPQLHNAKELVVATVPEWPNASAYRKQIQEVISNNRDNRIVVLLCPGMQKETREQIRRELHSTSHFAAVLDDLDLVRLLNPGGTQPNLLLGMLEIVLEQQPRKARNPFLLSVGREMRLEMYVGRRDEAEQLATTSAKTRLFSGRKLGKTALLQFIRQTWNGRELPNGRTLRVVYLSIVGVSSEENFAKKFLAQLRADFPAMKLPENLLHPFEIVDAIRVILDAAPAEDILFVLDEADAFVADQVRLDNVRKGTGLSWRLRDIERARFVFTGYWATATRDGVWCNWGDVLELSQLQPEEAAGLIANPLARMGIDAADQAPEIAFRCGYQPAVLLRFGEALIERLGQDTMKDQVMVSHDVVQDVFADVKVQKEIQGVVRANFQANPVGHAIFCVVLEESARAPLGCWLADLESTVAANFDSLVDESVKTDLRVTIAAQLRDMHQRKLLRRRVREGQIEYQLTFPHHLSTLLQDLDIDAEIKADLRAWRETHSGGDDAPLGEGRSPIHRLDLAAVRDLLNPELIDYTPKAVVVASTWPTSLVSEPGGVPDRLHLRLQVEAASLYAPESPVRCWKQAGHAHLDRVMQSEPAQRPVFLFGDIALLRAALARRASGDLDLDVFGTHRFTDGQVRWWFQRIQGVEFDSAGDYEHVHRITGGVPFLVDAFQTCLMPNGSPDGGLTPSAAVLSEAVAEFRRLVECGPLGTKLPASLTPRELELLRMVVTISDKDAGASCDRFQPVVEWICEFWTSDFFEEAWRKHFTLVPFPQPYGRGADDLVSLETLVLAGLVRSRRDTAPATARLLAFEDGDPIVVLTKRLT